MNNNSANGDRMTLKNVFPCSPQLNLEREIVKVNSSASSYIETSVVGSILYTNNLNISKEHEQNFQLF